MKMILHKQHQQIKKRIIKVNILLNYKNNLINYIFFINNTVCILLNATGNVPIIKKRTWTVDPNKTVSWIQKFIHKYLKLDPSEQIVSIVN